MSVRIIRRGFQRIMTAIKTAWHKYWILLNPTKFHCLLKPEWTWAEPKEKEKKKKEIVGGSYKMNRNAKDIQLLLQKMSSVTQTRIQLTIQMDNTHNYVNTTTSSNFLTA